MHLLSYNKICKIILSAMLVSAFASCDETSEIGSSIVDDQVDVVIDSVFVITGSSQENNIR